MEGRASLRIFFPCYNDAGTIGEMVARAREVARELTDDYEVLVVDDGSTDGSRDLLLALQEADSSLMLIFHGRNLGYGGALRSGLFGARKDLVFYTDGDGQYDVGELRTLWGLMGQGVDVVNGYKLGRSDPWYRVVAGNLYLRLVRMLFRFQIRDVDCDFRLIRRRALEMIALEQTSGAACVELVKRLELAGCRFVEAPVRHYPRACGRSQFFRPRRLLRTVSDVLWLWWRVVVRRNVPAQSAAGSVETQQERA